MKKILSVLLCLLLTAVLTISVFADGSVSFSMEASQATLYRGDSVTVNVSAFSTTEATSYGLQLHYDADVFELVSGKTETSALINSFKNGFAFMYQTPTAHSGYVGNATLQVKENAPVGTYTISGVAAVKNGNVVVAASGCSVTVVVTCAHEYSAWEETADGHQRICPKCDTVDAQPHSWDEGTVNKAATCAEEGEIAYTCTACQATKTEVLLKTEDHVFGNLTSVDENHHKDTCAVCQKEVTEPHNWDEGTVTTAPTCIAEGVKTILCPDCGASKTEVMPVSTEHAWGSWTKTDADTHKRVCSVCAKEESEDHLYNSAWSKDSSKHWHQCLVCGNQKDAEDHIPGAEPTETTAQTCTTCGYILKAALDHTEHQFAAEWSVDETGHWHACSGCEEKDQFAAHDFENDCDPDCSVCAYTRETAHIYSEAWTSDAENHWHACSGCGDAQDLQPHTMDDAQICTVCGYENVPSTDVEESQPEDTQTPTETEPEHTPKMSDEPAHKKDTSILWVLLVLGVLALMGGLSAFLRSRGRF